MTEREIHEKVEQIVESRVEVILSRLDGLTDTIRGYQAQCQRCQETFRASQVEQARTDERLRSGNKRFETIDVQLNARMEKNVFYAYATGIALVAGFLGWLVHLWSGLK